MSRYFYRARIDVWVDDWGCSLQCSTTRLDALGDILDIVVHPVDSQTTPQEAFTEALTLLLSDVEGSQTMNEGGRQL